MSIRRDLKYCFPHSFSNDEWDGETVQALDARLSEWAHGPSESAALVVGSGGLPYLLGRLPVSKIFVVDLSSKVLETTAKRIGGLSRYSDWESYHRGLSKELSGGLHFWRRFSYWRERRIAERSGLAGDYTATQQGAKSAQIEYLQGDVRTVAQHVGDIATREGLRFAFVNLSNAADYMLRGDAEVGDILSVLPITPNTTVATSSVATYLRPSLQGPVDNYGLNRAPVFT